MKKLISLLVLVGSMVRAEAPPDLYLEVVDQNGPGTIIKDVMVMTNGEVLVSTHGSTAQFLKVISVEEQSSTEASAAKISAGDLVKIDPNQHYNPGGFKRTYYICKSETDKFVFAQNVSGVDFRLPGSPGQDLVLFLDALTK